MNYIHHCCQRESVSEKKTTWGDCVETERKKKKTLDDCDNPDRLKTYQETAQDELALRRERM
jgi:hypothetical protein